MELREQHSFNIETCILLKLLYAHRLHSIQNKVNFWIHVHVIFYIFARIHDPSPQDLVFFRVFFVIVSFGLNHHKLVMYLIRNTFHLW